MSTTAHRGEAPQEVSVHVVTVSDTRTLDTDASGRLIVALLEGAGHRVHGRTLLRDEPADVRQCGRSALAHSRRGRRHHDRRHGHHRARRHLRGGRRLLTKRLPGFGELFRSLSYQQIGAAAMLSRATAGLVDRTVVIVLPGSQHAVRLALEELVLPEIGHLVHEARR